MTAERWRQIEKVFEAVSDYPAAERESRLTEECAGDIELRREVESLLSCDQEDEHFAEEAVQGTAEILARETSVSVVGKRFGMYRITQIISHGGMGSVYEAVRDDGHYEQKVAIKLIKRGMETSLDIRRFRRERQILARLDHPHIGRLLDGGSTPEGLPYLVMEYVEGRSITEYCRDQSLSIEEILKLVLQVAGAVQYAHQKLVVHRDLKPGNILVTSESGPKLLDFGIAQLVQPEEATDPLSRTYTTMLLTPDYASPEQIRGEPVTAGSDVYSLGLVLYELLTGKKAHRIRGRSRAEIERVVCHTEVETPSAAAGLRGLRGDLDNILLMALRKEPDRRYSSIEALAEDIRRYLDGRPVSARPDTLTYRAGKFIWRNRLGLTAASIVVLSLIGGIVAIKIQSRRAERRFQQVRELAATMIFDVDDRISNLAGTLQARVFLADTAIRYYDSLAQESHGDESLQWELAKGYERVGRLQAGNLSNERQGHLGPGLGKDAAALVSFHKALVIEERLVSRHPNRDYRQHLMMLYQNIGMLEPDAERAIEYMRKGLLVASEMNPRPKGEAGANLSNQLLVGLGKAQLRAGDPRSALASYRSAAAAIEAREGAAAALAAMGDLEQSLKMFQDLAAFAELRMSEAGWPEGSIVWRSVARYLATRWLAVANLLGNPRELNLGRPDEASPYCRRAISLAERLVRRDPNDIPVKHVLSDAYLTEAALLQDRSSAKALESARKAIPSAAAHAQIAYSLSKLGRREEALSELKRAINEGNSSPETAVFIHHQLGDLSGDSTHYRQALAIAENAVAQKPLMMPLRRTVADCYEKLGQFDKSLEIWRRWTNFGISSPYDKRRERQAEAALKNIQHP